MPDLRQLTADYVTAIHTADMDAAGRLMADDFILQDPSGTFAGREAVVAYMTGIFSTATGLSFTARNIIVEDSISVIEFELTLNGQKLVGTDVIEWREARMTAMRAYLY